MSAERPDAEPPLVTLLSDFGDRDGYPGTMRGVVAAVAPRARVIDVTHAVPAYDVRAGALVLAAALPYFPPGCHVAVVDPGVGTARRPVAVLTGRGDVLVGPDNGLLLPAADALGGAVEARLLDNPAQRLPDVLASFHGRDVFAPAAAHLAAGAAFVDVGPTLPLGSLVALALPHATAEPGVLRTAVLLVDGFGSCALAGSVALLEESLGPLGYGDALRVETPRGTHRLSWQPTFGAVGPGALLLHEDSARRLALAVSSGDAAEVLGLQPDDPVTVTRA